MEEIRNIEHPTPNAGFSQEIKSWEEENRGDQTDLTIQHFNAAKRSVARGQLPMKQPKSFRPARNKIARARCRIV